jgi:hypothetical protein
MAMRTGAPRKPGSVRMAYVKQIHSGIGGARICCPVWGVICSHRCLMAEI